MIKNIIEDAIKKLNSAKSSAINTALAKNNSEVVQPRIEELEKAKNEKINEVNQKASESIAEITKSFANSKTTFENSQIASVTASVGAEYDSQIATLQNIVDKLGDDSN